MQRILFLLIIYLFVVAVGTGQPMETGKADYDIEVYLDEEAKSLRGKTKLTWWNPSDVEVSTLRFHLYYNAFKNTSSTFLKNRQDFGLILSSLKEDCGYAFSTVLSLKDSLGNELESRSKYVSPDDGNPNDQTVLLVELDQPIAPRTNHAFVMEWEAKIPKTMIRTGYNQEYYFFAQWYPKLGVYEPKGMRYSEDGAWNCHQYHASGEYYGEFGDYNVTLNVPAHFEVGASGVLVDTLITNERKTWTFQVDSVIDFTWSCSPHFRVFEDQWEDVALKLYSYPSHITFVERYFDAARNALAYMKEHVGAYPYETLTMIDPPLHGLFTGGMEYPTLISSLSSNFLPSGVKSPETLVVHEFVHQYFMQMVATNEQEEPWMDEGLTTYYEGRILDHYYGTNTSLIDVWGVQLGNKVHNRYEYLSSENPKIADNSYKARDFIHGGYGTIAYNKTAMMLKTMEGILGQERMDEIMSIYFETWKYHHPCGQDFITIFKEELSKDELVALKFDLDQFFEQVLYGSFECDYSVQSINQQRISWEGGYFDNLDSCTFVELEKDETSHIESAVIVRQGEVILPIDIVLIYEDGSTTKEIWDGRARSTEVLGEVGKQIEKVIIDPAHKLDLDKNWINNSYVRTSNKGYKKYTYKLKVWTQHLLDALSFLS